MTTYAKTVRIRCHSNNNNSIIVERQLRSIILRPTSHATYTQMYQNCLHNAPCLNNTDNIIQLRVVVIVLVSCYLSLDYFENVRCKLNIFPKHPNIY